jgi:hypothetical protein
MASLIANCNAPLFVWHLARVLKGGIISFTNKWIKLVGGQSSARRVWGKTIVPDAFVRRRARSDAPYWEMFFDTNFVN